MKKIILSAALLLTITAAGWSASRPTHDGPNVRELFKKEFAGAQQVRWSTEDNYDKVCFVLADYNVIAYYDDQQQLAGCIRNISYEQLPLGVMRIVDRRFSKATMLEVTELTNPEETFYRLTLTKGNKRYTVKVTSEGVITDVKKQTL